MLPRFGQLPSHPLEFPNHLVLSRILLRVVKALHIIFAQRLARGGRIALRVIHASRVLEPDLRAPTLSRVEAEA